MITGKTATAEAQYFATTQRIEREKLRILFNKCLRFHDCDKFNLTSETDFSDYDAFMLSGFSNVIIEMKVRDSITINRHNDCIIELPKFKNLFNFYKAGNKVLYVVEYSDYVVIWELNKLYKFLQDNNYPLDTWFIEMDCQRNGYSKEVKQKQVRYLQFYEASYFISKKDYQLHTKFN